MSFNDSRLDHLSHFGVKGMKWGVRKAVYGRQKALAKSYTKDAANFREAANQLRTGEGNLKGVRGDSSEARRAAADEFDELSALTTDSRMAKKLSRKASKLRKGAMKRDEEAALFDEIADSFDVNSKSIAKSAQQNKAKIDSLKQDIEAGRQKKLDDTSINSGRDFVNIMFTGNNKGQMTKGAWAQYAVAGGVIGVMALGSLAKKGGYA
jgi:hypothetical protein